MNQYELLSSNTWAWNEYRRNKPENEIHLSGAYLSGTNLSGADHSRAFHSGAELSGTYLNETNRSEANLSRTNLSGANLSGADLSGADLSETSLNRAKGIKILGQDPRGYIFYMINQEESYKIHAGCRWFTYDEAINHWSSRRHNESLTKEILLYVGMAKNLAELHEWE